MMVAVKSKMTIIILWKRAGFTNGKQIADSYQGLNDFGDRRDTHQSSNNSGDRHDHKRGGGMYLVIEAMCLARDKNKNAGMES